MRSWLGLALAFLLLQTPASWADVVILKDGTRLRCDVVEQNEDEPFIRIRVGGSLMLLRRDVIQQIEEMDNGQPTAAPNEDLIQRLIDEGNALANIEQAEEAPAPSDQPLRVESVRGWAYLKQGARETALEEEQRVPTGQEIEVSPNSRLTLAIEGTGQIGLTGGSVIRFDEINWDQTIQFYNINARLLHGDAWFRIGEDDSSWRRVRLTVNSVNGVFQQALLLAQSGERSGSVYLTLLEGSNQQKFWRGSNDGPYTIRPGQRIFGNPASNTLDTQAAQNQDAWLNQVETWEDWQPEQLAMPLNEIVPPLYRYPGFDALPALHPHRIRIDGELMLPPETRSLGRILDAYRESFAQYKYDTGSFPDPEIGIQALWEKSGVPGWRGPYISAQLPRRDLWGSPFVYELYEIDGEPVPSVRSLGPNQKDDFGLGDDIR